MLPIRIIIADIILTLILLTIVDAQTTIVADHYSTSLSKIPVQWIDSAKSKLRIAYGHTSHGSQLTDGMSGLVSWKGTVYSFNNGGIGGALDLHDYAMAGDCGYYPDWVNNTRAYLNTSTNSDVNVIIWSWCGQVSSQSEQSMMDNYLLPMTQLELDYPYVKFVYMTGHLDGSGRTGNLNIRNDQIRAYCRTNNKILYDFADIESYDPDGLVNFMELYANDNCDYDSSGIPKNWAQIWQNTHVLNVDWYDCSAAHSQPLNGNRKAYAAWWLWARLAGWNDSSTTIKKGWNLVSVPLLQTDYRSEIVFAGKSGNIFGYNPTTKSYEAATTVSCGHGYWALYQKAEDVTFDGLIPGPLSISVTQPGWVLIGSHDTSLQVSSLELSGGAVIQGSVFRYDALSKSYAPTTVINPGESVWANLTKACTITIP